MSYETLEKEIKTLPESSIAELEDFVAYLKLKDRFADFEHRADAYEIAEKLDEADLHAASTKTRLTHEEFFSNIRSQCKGD